MTTVGVFLSTAHFPEQSYHEVFDNVLTYAQAAERLSYDAVWVNEHHFIRFGACSSSLAVAGFLLGHTRRIRVGTAVVLVPLHHPIEVAEHAVLLDHLSGGRLDLGLGRGAYPRDLAVFGCPIEKTQQAMFENVDVILRAWSQEAVGLDSDLRRFPPVSVTPKPRTQLHPPVYIAAGSPETVTWAARRGLPMLFGWYLSIDEMARQADLYAQIASEAGHDPATIAHVVAGIGHVASSREEATRALMDNLIWWSEVGQAAGSHDDLAKYEGYRHLQQRDTRNKALGITNPRDMAQHLIDVNPVGTAEQCRAWLQEASARTGARRFAVLLDLAAQREPVLENLERFAHEVVAPLTSASAQV
ncbi:MAG: LLM class flavin-dependent oxidoreductase [Deltaproteobacteria bacterium]|nr:LLM class flavin-dependent oxidoreductase [Deltaproteobacteria bacterium]